ncbi:MAG TPA: hypothetical protein DHW61_16415 [Lachnoclostridium phytofermentans]|uniref:Uncharacterized protein n=1 Tax=Lachnoclostridium phytofermentans TaxID=66219 RepID=A0A3D2XBJ2_9FIRM|nr:hypothetical protein [Lachnoclostridium sp.]HCL03963.1 hypothetical protein [Lachnoclostridium phytofermentans]
MKKNKYLLKISLFVFIIFIGVMMVYKISTPVLNNKDIKDFKKTCSMEYEYIDKIKFIYNEAGLEIQFYTKDISDNEANHIVSATQKFVSTPNFLDYFSGKYRKKYKNITKHLPNDYVPPATIIIHEENNIVPNFKYSSSTPYINWSSMN